MSDEPLDLANRFVIAVAALAVAFAAALVALLAWGAGDASIGRLEDFTGFLRDHSDRDGKVIATMAAAIVVLLMAAVILVESTVSPTQRMRLRNVKAGAATLTTKEIAARLEDEARTVPHVLDAAAIVAVRGAAVEVVLDLHVSAAADLAQTADEACRRAHALAEQQMGVPLAKRPRARMHYRELRLPRTAAAQPVPPPPPTGWERPQTEERHDERPVPGPAEEA